MTLPLDNNHHVSVNAHSGKVWLSVYSGTGAVVPLSKKQAMQLRRMLFDAVYQEEIPQQSGQAQE
jgi:hypothetical protein